MVRGSIVSLFFIILMSSLIIADGGFFLHDSYLDEDLYEPEQKAIIIYDKNKESLIIQASSEGDVSNFAWVIPVPSYPEIEESDSRFFDELHYLTRPDVISAISPFSLISSGILSRGLGGVTVHEQKTLGIFDAVVLSSEDSNSLITWLNNNSYYIPEFAEEVLDSYIENSWYFVAMKVNKENNPLLKSFKRIDDKIYDKNSSIEIISEKILEAVKQDDKESINGIFGITNPYSNKQFFSESSYQELEALYFLEGKYFIDEYVSIDLKGYEDSYFGHKFGIVFYKYSNLKSRGVRTYIDLFDYDDGASVKEVEEYLELDLSMFDIEGYPSMGMAYTDEARERETIGRDLEKKVSTYLSDQLSYDIENNISFGETIWNDYMEKSDYEINPEVEIFYNQLLEDYYNRDNLIHDEIRVRLEPSLVYLRDDFSQIIPGKENLNILNPVLIKFDSEEIIFPFKISSINKGETEVLLYVLADSKTKIEGFDIEFADNFPNTNSYLSELLSENYNYFLTKHRAKFETKDIKDDIVIEKSTDNSPYRMEVYEYGFIKWFFVTIITFFLLYGWVAILSLAPKKFFNWKIKDTESAFYFTKFKLLVYCLVFPLMFLFSFIPGLFGEVLKMFLFFILFFPPIIGVMIFITVMHFLISMIIKMQGN